MTGTQIAGNVVVQHDAAANVDTQRTPKGKTVMNYYLVLLLSRQRSINNNSTRFVVVNFHDASASISEILRLGVIIIEAGH